MDRIEHLIAKFREEHPELDAALLAEFAQHVRRVVADDIREEMYDGKANVKLSLQIHGHAFSAQGPREYVDNLLGNYPLTVGKSRAKFGTFVTRQTPEGYSYAVWEVPMPRINDDLLNIAFYLYQTEEGAKTGKGAGGSGFLVSIPVANHPELSHLYAVTNAHVVRAGCRFMRLNTTEGKAVPLATEVNAWTLAQNDDLAVLPMVLSQDFQFNAVPPYVFLTKQVAEKVDIGPGDEVALIGRMITREGVQRNKPAVRFGHISVNADPDELVQLDTGLQEAYIVDCRSISGFSGSAVLLYLHRDRADGRNVIGPIGPKLLGVNCAHLPMWQSVYQGKAKTDYRVETNTGMAVVIPPWRLQLLLDEEHLVNKRKEVDEAINKQSEAENKAVSDLTQDDDPAFTKADFEKALKQVARKLSDSEKSQT